MKGAKRIVETLLLKAGININGPNPWDLKVHNEQFYSKLLWNAELALGETYVEGWWDCEALDEFFYRILRSNLDNTLKEETSFWINNLQMSIRALVRQFINLQTQLKAFEVGKKHYDIGNDLFSLMLDKRMIYTCAFWDNVNTLDEAQERKLEITCQKLQLKPGMTVLDIGCGWGGLAQYMVENYDISVVGITISKQQFEVAKTLEKNYPIKILLEDYRDLLKNNCSFDRVVSLGMFEHVGHANYSCYMQVVNHCLTHDGLFLLHTIGANHTRTYANAWIEKYIFPNGHLPSIVQIAKASEDHFVMEDWQNYGAYYDKTLMAWYKNFNERLSQDPTLRILYNTHFQRLWNFYLLSCAGSFRARRNQLWQIVLSKNGWVGGYSRQG